MAVRLIEVNQISKTYVDSEDRVNTVLDQLSFDINKGEIFGLLGPNGAGKTTFIKILLGLTKATKGQILIEDKEVGTREVKRLIGYVPEKVAFNGNLTAHEIMNFYCDLKEVPRNKSLDMLERVGLKDHAFDKVGNFSKGMAQRVGLAQALLAKPKVLILDEPTSGLDPIGVVQFKQIIQELSGEGITILLTSHVMSEVEELAERIAIIKKGKLLAVDTINGLQRELELNSRIKVYFNTPVPELINTLKRAEATNVEIDETIVSFACNPEQKGQILKEVLNSGGEVLDLKSFEPSLEEIFVKVLNTAKPEIIQNAKGKSPSAFRQGIVKFNLKAITSIAKNEFMECIRDKWILAISGIFAILAIAISYFGMGARGQIGLQSFEITISSLMNLVIYLVPLIGLFMGYSTISGEKEQGSLAMLLTQPLSRSDVLLGKFIGLALALTTASLFGFGSAGLLLIWRVGVEGLANFGYFLLSSMGLGLVFLSIGLFISVITPRRSSSAVGAVFIWFWLIFIYDLLLLGLIIILSKYINPSWMTGFILLSPGDVFRLANILHLESLKVTMGLINGISSSVLNPGIIIGVFATWILAPLLGALYLFNKEEF